MICLQAKESMVSVSGCVTPCSVKSPTTRVGLPFTKSVSFPLVGRGRVLGRIEEIRGAAHVLVELRQPEFDRRRIHSHSHRAGAPLLIEHDGAGGLEGELARGHSGPP